MASVKTVRKGGIPITEKRSLPKPDTTAYRLLALTAISGELPTDLLPRLPGGERYKELTILSLKEKGLLHTYYRDHLRGYRLGRRAKTLLLESRPERFSFFLTGNRDTNLLKSELTRRLRLHQIADLTVLAQNAGVHIFRDDKPDLFTENKADADHLFSSDLPCFYSSREVKALGADAVKIRGSRMCGVLLASSGIYLAYHGERSPPKWEAWAEEKAKSMVQSILCHERLTGLYGSQDVHALLACTGMEPLVKILAKADTPDRCFFLLDNNYSHFYYLTNDHKGEILLQLLCSPEKQAALDRLLRSELRAPDPNAPVEQDALDPQGRPVLFSYLPNIPRLGRFIAALRLFDRQGCIVCFDFQAQALRACCGANISILSLDSDRFEKEGLL